MNTVVTMAHRDVTLEQLPKQMISIRMLREAFEKCTPYNCPSRTRLNYCYPQYSWDTSPSEDITMEHAVRVIHYCLSDTEYLSRFAFYFTGECVAPYDVIATYISQTFVKT
jgi:hypothetical protein